MNNLVYKYGERIKTGIYNKRHYIFAFFIPAAILAVAYIVAGVYPFGGRTVLTADLAAQYIDFFEYLKRAAVGEASLLNSWSKNLNGENIGTFAYYLASPFNIIILLFPARFITEAVLMIQLLKTGFAGDSGSLRRMALNSGLSQLGVGQNCRGRA
ncbi:MAG: YfhO family protein [Oscillospiraceae bacterium]|nr:YfhO family protein [Oscillospiraceae bacterium]